MPHCFKLARRVSRFRAECSRTSMISMRTFAAFTLGVATLGLVGCNENDPMNPVSEAGQTASGAEDSAIVALTDTTGDGVNPALAAAVTGTTIYPGQDIQAAVASAPGGTTFTLKAGVHRLQSIAPKTGR